MNRITLKIVAHSLFVPGALLATFAGCESQSGTADRAGYEADRHGGYDDSRSARLEPRIRPAEFNRQAVSGDFARAGRFIEPRSLEDPIPTPVTGRPRATHEAESGTAEFAAATMPPTTAPAVPSLPPADAAMCLRQADEHNRAGTAAAAKAVWFTARTEFSEALRLTAAAGDANESRTDRTIALTNGLTALTEAEEIAAAAAGPSIDLEAIRRRHRTPAFLPAATRGLSLPALHDAYLTFAKEELASAVAGGAAGSVALHGLGKVHAAAGQSINDARAKAMVFYESALIAAPANFLAANDLAVLLAEDGRLEQARDVLHAGLRQASQPAMWKNLAAVHDRLNQPQLAQRARLEAAAMEQTAAGGTTGVMPTHNVVWLDPRGFANTNRPPAEAQYAAPIAATAPSGVQNAAAADASPSDAATRPAERAALRPRTGIMAY